MPGPYVTAALICDRVLVETDGTPSAIRIIDRVLVQQPPTAEIPTLGFFSVLLMLKWGDFSGQSVPRVALISPDGLSTELLKLEQPIGPSPAVPIGANIHGAVELVLKQLGRYWLVFYFGDVEVSRTPLAVEVQASAGKPPSR